MLNLRNLQGCQDQKGKKAEQTLQLLREQESMTVNDPQKQTAEGFAWLASLQERWTQRPLWLLGHCSGWRRNSAQIWLESRKSKNIRALPCLSPNKVC